MLCHRVRALELAPLVFTADHFVQAADFLEVQLPRFIQVLEVPNLLIDALDLGPLLAQFMIPHGLQVLVHLRFHLDTVLLLLPQPLVGLVHFRVTHHFDFGGARSSGGRVNFTLRIDRLIELVHGVHILVLFAQPLLSQFCSLVHLRLFGRHQLDCDLTVVIFRLIRNVDLDLNLALQVVRHAALLFFIPYILFSLLHFVLLLVVGRDLIPDGQRLLLARQAISRVLQLFLQPAVVVLRAERVPLVAGNGQAVELVDERQ